MLYRENTYLFDTVVKNNNSIENLNILKVKFSILITV